VKIANSLFTLASRRIAFERRADHSATRFGMGGGYANSAADALTDVNFPASRR
jgi:hypothetical protein